MKKKMLREMMDTPYHIGYVKMDEKDSRRDKRRCIYFETREECKSFCIYSYAKCISSSHCKYYKEKNKEENCIEETKKEFKNKNKYIKKDNEYTFKTLKQFKEHIFSKLHKHKN